MIDVCMGRYLLLGWVLVCAVLLAWVISAQGNEAGDAIPPGAEVLSGQAMEGVRTEASTAPAAGQGEAAGAVPEAPPEVTSFDSEHLALRSTYPCRLDLLASVAEDACALAHALTDLPVPDGPLPIHICDSEEAVLAVAEKHGVSALGGAVGKFYPKGPMVIVRDGATLPQTIRHEVVHWVIRVSNPGCPPVVSEGLAEVVEDEPVAAGGLESAHRSPASDPSAIPRTARHRIARMRRYLTDARLRRVGDLAHLEGFWGLEPDLYSCDSRCDTRVHRDLAWCLMRVWIREGEAVGMPLKNLCRVVHDSQPSLRGLLRDDAAYERLEAAWKHEIEAIANG